VGRQFAAGVIAEKTYPMMSFIEPINKRTQERLGDYICDMLKQA